MDKQKIIDALDVIARELELYEPIIPTDKLSQVPLATEKQIELMKELKIEIPENCDKLQASKLITAKIGNRPMKKNPSR